MPQYVRIENNQIVEGPRDLPTSTATVSNFHLGTPEFLAEHGWYQYIEAARPTFDPATERLQATNDFEATSVTVSFSVVPKTEEEIAAYAAMQAAKTGNVRDITKRQFMLQCKAEGLWVTVKALIAADEDTQELYDATSIISRNDPMVIALATAIGKTSAEIDTFFHAAYNL